MLRILQRNPDRIRMDRLGEYMRQFAELLGTENFPTFKGIKQASTGLKADIPVERQHYTKLRLVEAKTNFESRPARILRSIEDLMGKDAIKEAQLLDSVGNVVYLFRGHVEEPDKVPKLQQQGIVDGIVTGIVGADDTMHLHLRDHFDQDLKLVIRNENLARDLLKQFREGHVRLTVHGTWHRTDFGWVPESNKCTVESFEVLEETPLQDVFMEIAEIPGNGWKSLDDPIFEWEKLRGLH
ncbi:MAG: hypothetical protein NTZ64_06415 [Polaromonas sp.]|nr:hypothetical protein [Polaromonas sp.]